MAAALVIRAAAPTERTAGWSALAVALLRGGNPAEALLCARRLLRANSGVTTWLPLKRSHNEGGDLSSEKFFGSGGGGGDGGGEDFNECEPNGIPDEPALLVAGPCGGDCGEDSDGGGCQPGEVSEGSVAVQGLQALQGSGWGWISDHMDNSGRNHGSPSSPFSFGASSNCRVRRSVPNTRGSGIDVCRLESAFPHRDVIFSGDMHDPAISRTLLPPPADPGLRSQDLGWQRDSLRLKGASSPVGSSSVSEHACASGEKRRGLVNGVVAEVMALAVIAAALHRLRLFDEAADAAETAASAAAACGHPATHCQVQILGP